MISRGHYTIAEANYPNELHEWCSNFRTVLIDGNANKWAASAVEQFLKRGVVDEQDVSSNEDSESLKRTFATRGYDGTVISGSSYGFRNIPRNWKGLLVALATGVPGWLVGITPDDPLRTAATSVSLLCGVLMCFHSKLSREHAAALVALWESCSSESRYVMIAQAKVAIAEEEELLGVAATPAAVDRIMDDLARLRFVDVRAGAAHILEPVSIGW